MDAALRASRTAKPLIFFALGHIPVLLFFSVVDPFREEFFPCAIREEFDWLCPGCGGTRAAYALFTGDLALSVRMNPIAIVAYVEVGVLAAVSTLCRRLLGSSLFFGLLEYTLIGTIVYAGLLRNLTAC